MIEITVGGAGLYIPADTELTLEQNAAWANLDEIGGDIVWTFTVPARANEQVLEQAGYIVVSRHKRYDAEVRFDGVPIARGELYVQQAQDERELNCGMTLNTFAPGWGAKKLKDNPYNEVVTIGTSADTYQAEWLAFLKGTLAADSLYKFFLFIDQEFMGDNPDYGWYRGALSHLTSNSAATNQMAKYVNRLLVDGDGEIINRPDSDGLGARIFNSEEGVATDAKVNGYHWAPAIRLDHLVRKVLESCGMGVQGSFLRNAFVRKLYSQSLNAMDGNILQYPVTQDVNLSGDITPGSGTPTTIEHTFPFTSSGAKYTDFGVQQGLISGGLGVGFKMLLPVVGLESRDIDEPAPGEYDHYDEAFFLVFRHDSSVPLPKHRANLNAGQTEGDPVYIYGDIVSAAVFEHTIGSLNDGTMVGAGDEDLRSGNHLFSRPGSALMLQMSRTVRYNPQFGNINSEYYMGTATVNASMLTGLSQNMTFFVQLVKCRVKTFSGSAPYVYRLETSDGEPFNAYPQTDDCIIEELYDYEVIDFAHYQYCDTMLNVFAKELDLRQHVPNLSNGEFLKELCKFFGLTMYAGGFQRRVQLSFFRDVFSAGSMAIDEYVVGMTKLTYDTHNYQLKVQPVLGVMELNPQKDAGTYTTREELPFPQTKKGKYAFVRNENRWRKSENREEDEESGTNSTVYNWLPNKGNNAALGVGDAEQDEEEMKSAIKVPNMRWTDTKATPKYLNEVPQAGCSAMMQDEYTGEFDFILQQYRGRRLLQLQSLGVVTSGYIEDANPTWYNEDGTVDREALNLTATGEQSVGEMWQKPYYGFLATKEDFEFVVRVPARVFLDLYALLQPQDKPESEQVRWVSFRSQRYLPSRISYQFGKGGTVVATITCSREHYPN